VTKSLWSPNWSRANSDPLNKLVETLSGNAPNLGQPAERAKGCGTTTATLLLIAAVLVLKTTRLERS
jgi:hypothetical protein